MQEFTNQLIGTVAVAVQYLLGQLLVVIRYPLDPSQRIFVVFLATSLILAAFVYFRRRRTGGSENFGAFLFPRSVWSNPSAWLDVRYFFFHQIFWLVIYGSFLIGIITLVSGWANDFALYLTSDDKSGPGPLRPLATVMLISVIAVASDFTSFLAHYLQHKVPILWEFHKVHHSATVMHPLTNYREHPVDNILYAVALGSTIAVVSGLTILCIGRVPDMSTLSSGGVIMLAFNLLGYNLRHSHIWLKWPGALSKIFGSPAHHQVHHSCHPDHIDKNFAFMFPVWDVLFRTYEMPENDRTIQLGLGNPEECEFRSCLTLYFLPFCKAFRHIRSPANSAPERPT